MKSPSRSLVIILVSFMINIAFFSSNPTFTSSSEDNKLFTSFNAFPGIMTLALFVILSILQLLTANLYPSIATKLLSPSTIYKSSPINIGFV